MSLRTEDIVMMNILLGGICTDTQAQLQAVTLPVMASLYSFVY